MTKKAMTFILVAALLFCCVSISACSNRVDTQRVTARDSVRGVDTTGNSASVLDNERASVDTNQDEPANNNAGNNRVGTPDANYVLPPEAEFYSFIETRLYEEIDSGRLLLNTTLERPVELDVRKYHLPGSSPEIHVNAIVFEQVVGDENGKAITYQIVEIMLEWLDHEGFEPFGTFMMPISYVVMETVDEAGNTKDVNWGNSMYNPFTGKIE